jgi:hypothetical protein
MGEHREECLRRADACRFWAIIGRQQFTPLRSSADRFVSAFKTARNTHIKQRVAGSIPASPTIQSWQIEVVSWFELTVVISMAWLYLKRSAIGICPVCARSVAGSGRQSLATKFRFPNREMVYFERERLRKG